jgi:uncharacterized protein (TIGR02246 family)
MRASPTRALFAVVIGIALFALAASTQTPLGTSADKTAILKFRDAHNVAWNNRDPKALANLYAPDGDRISASGVHYIGRDQIEQSYVNAFKGAYKNSPVKDESTAVRFLTADVALVDVDDTITGVGGGTTVHHHVASIYVKRNGQWDMVAERATLKQ